MALTTTSPSLTGSWAEIVTAGETYIIQVDEGIVQLNFAESEPASDAPYIQLSPSDTAISGVVPASGKIYARSEGGAVALVKY